jgi:hypothetical protein
MDNLTNFMGLNTLSSMDIAKNLKKFRKERGLM